MVDTEILTILRQRFEDCMLHEMPDHLTTCKPLLDKYKEAEEAWFIKCLYHIMFILLTSEFYSNY